MHYTKVKFSSEKSSKLSISTPEDFQLISYIHLEPNNICLYRDVCKFNRKPEQCYGARERNNEFTCNLVKLRTMYKNI